MKITIVIPVYNTEKYLDQCIESVRGQRYQEWEIIAIDDGSTDASLEILKKYRELDSRITIHEQRNQGAHGEIILLFWIRMITGQMKGAWTNLCFFLKRKSALQLWGHIFFWNKMEY